ncbi:MAG: anti-sigma F factor [Lachnospiraceae bacterium]|nr:anti-sigma F factor [Lachnospiraceae bacterium]
MGTENHMQVFFDARSVNEGLARMLVGAFMMGMNPTLDQLEDVKTAVSEAVTNAIIHGYQEEEKQVELVCDREGQQLVVTVEDHGAGIENVPEAMQPFYTSKPGMERSGMGFTFMEAFMDKVEVSSRPGEGTKVVMWKYIPQKGDGEQ